MSFLICLFFKLFPLVSSNHVLLKKTKILAITLLQQTKSVQFSVDRQLMRELSL